MRRTLAWRRPLAGLGLALALVVPASSARALFHFAVIDEVLASHGGDPQIQFIEIKMLAPSQNLITVAVLAVFDADGEYLKDVIVFDHNVPFSGDGVRFLVATPAADALAGFAADFPMAADLPTSGGMVCYGGGGGILPVNPPNWDRNDLDSYVDCLAYGSYSGPTASHSGNPTPLAPIGHSLVRISDVDDNATDFDCGDPLTPQNNAGTNAAIDASVMVCPEPAAALLQLAACGGLVWLRRRR